MVASRRKSREVALKTLYGIEISNNPSSEAFSDSLEENELTPMMKEYAEKLVYGVRGNLAELDALISKGLTNYSLDRLAVIDRNLLRVAAYELMYQPATPPAVSINEAVSLAKKYSTAESGQFVNGVLSYVLAQSSKANWDPATAPSEFEEEEEIYEADSIEPVVEEIVEPNTEAADEFNKVGKWTIKLNQR